MWRRARKDLIETALSSVASQFASIGLVKRKKDRFLLPTVDGFLGSFGIAKYVERGDGRLYLQIFVGIRSNTIEEMYCQITLENLSKFSPTVVTSLGRISQKPDEWVFEENSSCVETAKKIADSVYNFGFSFVRENSSIESLCRMLKTMQYPTYSNCEPRYIIALCVLGRKQEAIEYLKRRSVEVSNMNSKDVYTLFWEKFSRRLQEGVLSRA